MTIEPGHIKLMIFAVIAIAWVGLLCWKVMKK